MNTSATVFFLCCAIVFLPTATTLALTDNLTEAQIREAVEFGRTNYAGIEKTLNSLYACCGSSRDVVIRTKWCKLALVAGIKMQQGSDIAGRDQDAVLQDQSLQIDITVTGSGIEFAREYTAYVLQNGKKIMPDQLHADHFQAAQKKYQSTAPFAAYYAILRTYFKYEALDVQKRFSLILVKPQGTATYDIDPAKFK